MNKLFSELGLSPEILKAIDRLGFEQASPIQSEAIPLLLSGADVVGQSMTGSGKTAAFAIPAIEKIDPQVKSVQALILCPTRELAVQVCEEIHKLTFFKKGIHSLPIYGGQSYERQFFGLKQGAQIVIGTPGRIMDHMRRGTLRLETTKMAVLDEADVMLDMGFREDIEFILQAVPTTRQTVFFSATMPRPIQELIQKYAREPRSVRIDQKALTVPTVDQCYYEVDRRFKIELLTRLIDVHDLKLGIVFCNTKRMVDDLVDHLNTQGYSADRLHGDMTQAMRDRVMMKFRRSGLEFLVATDVAARGIDVDDVQVVFNFDLPYDAEDYVHRIGRTGRAGRSGLAISFVSGREIFMIPQIERYSRIKIRRAKIPTPAEVEEARSSLLLEKIRSTLKSGEYKRQDHLIERLLEEGFSSTDIASVLLHHLQSGEGSQSKPEGATPTTELTRSRPQRPSFSSSSDAQSPPSSSFAMPSRSRNESSKFDGRTEPYPRRPDIGKEPRPVVKSAATSPLRPATSHSATVVHKVVRLQPSVQDTALQSPATQGPPVIEPETLRTSPSAIPVHPKEFPRPEPRIKPEPSQRTRLSEARHDSEVESEAASHSRRTPDGYTRLYVNAGEEMNLTATEVRNAVMGTTGLPEKTLGFIDLRKRHLFMDVVSEHANGIISKMNRSKIKGRSIKVKLA